MTGPAGDMWRVDVDGIPVMVRGKEAKERMERVNHRNAKMKLALHRISKMHPSGGAGNVARDALSND